MQHNQQIEQILENSYKEKELSLELRNQKENWKGVFLYRIWTHLQSLTLADSGWCQISASEQECSVEVKLLTKAQLLLLKDLSLSIYLTGDCELNDSRVRSLAKLNSTALKECWIDSNKISYDWRFLSTMSIRKGSRAFRQQKLWAHALHHLVTMEEPKLAKVLFFTFNISESENYILRILEFLFEKLNLELW